MSPGYDIVVLGAGAIGTSVAFHAAQLGDGRILLLDRAGVAAAAIDAQQAHELLPLLDTRDLAVFGHEPDAGYADAYLVASGFAKAARRLGVQVRSGVTAISLITDGSRVAGVRTAQGDVHCGVVVSALNVWTPALLASLGIDVGHSGAGRRVYRLLCAPDGLGKLLRAERAVALARVRQPICHGCRRAAGPVHLGLELARLPQATQRRLRLKCAAWAYALW